MNRYAYTKNDIVSFIDPTGPRTQAPQNPAPGSFRACVGSLESTGFSQDAADLINQISGAEGTSRDLLAVTWMNKTTSILEN